jgi:hypothetical protein
MHLLVAVDKFTKWVEAKPIRKLDGKTALKFVKDIVVRFGIPHSIITDNGTNLSQGEVEEYSFGISPRSLSSVPPRELHHLRRATAGFLRRRWFFLPQTGIVFLFFARDLGGHFRHPSSRYGTRIASSSLKV